MNKKVITLLMSLILCFFLYIKFSIEPLLSLVLFFLFNYALSSLRNKFNKKYKKLSIIISIIFTTIYVICDSIEKTYTIDIINRYLLVNVISYFIIFYYSINSIFSFIDIKKDNSNRKIYIGNKEILTESRFSFKVNFILIFTVYLFFLLKFYPGILTFDSYNELSQVQGILPLMNNHSILHTEVLMIFYKIGNIFNSVNLGVFLYMLFQISLMSFVFSYVLKFMAKHKVPVLIRILSLLFFMFHPINIIYSICLWKDIFFSLSIIIFTVLIYYLTKDNNYFMNKKNIIIFGVISLLVMYLRNNGLYVVFITFIVLYIKYRKSIKRILSVFVSIIMLYFISKTIIFNVFNIKGVEIKEALSMPSQAIARIYKNNNISKEEKKEIEKFYSNRIGEVYIPIIADNTKNEMNQKYVKDNFGKYVLLNIKLFFTHNKEYMESFVSNNYGYYYMNTYYSPLFIQKTDLNGVVHNDKIGSFTLYMSIVSLLTIIMIIVLWNLNNKKNILLFGLLIPVLLSLSTSIKDNSILTLLFSIGFYSTICFILYVYNKKNKVNTSIYIPTIILWVTMLLSPVYSEFRYLYPMFLLIPIYLGLTFRRED